MKSFLKKIIAFFKDLFGDSKKTEPQPAPQPKPAPVQPKPPVEAPKPVESEEEPAQSSPNGTITSFLWKDSDTNPKGIVVSVSSDTLRAADVLMILKDPKGKVIKANQKYNIGGTLRANKLPGHKYGRFNFKPGGSKESFAKLQPITVSFVNISTGSPTPIKVMGKDSIVVKNALERLDLK